MPIRQLYTPAAWTPFRRSRASLVAKHPDAAWYIRIEPGDVWTPPAEILGLDEAGAKLRVAHRRAVRASLEQFVNAKLARLHRMVRTGWWILDEARVRIVRFRDVPE